MGVNAGSAPAAVPGQSWIAPLAADLKAANGACVVIAGERQPAAVHAIAHAINQALGAAGVTVSYTDPVEANPVDPMASLRDLVQDLNSGSVDTLLILDGNPAYTAPADIDFAGADPQGQIQRLPGSVCR